MLRGSWTLAAASSSPVVDVMRGGTETPAFAVIEESCEDNGSGHDGDSERVTNGLLQLLTGCIMGAGNTPWDST